MCDNDKFIPLDKIFIDNTLKSPIDGFVYKKVNADGDISLIIIKTLVSFEELELAFNNKNLFHYVITKDKQLVKFYKKR